MEQAFFATLYLMQDWLMAHKAFRLFNETLKVNEGFPAKILRIRVGHIQQSSCATGRQKGECMQ